jgi:hypothetical protein
MEDVFTRVRVGMARDEAERVLETYHGSIDDVQKKGTQCVLSVDAASGESVEVAIGTNGSVTAKHYSSDWFWKEWRVKARSFLAR